MLITLAFKVSQLPRQEPPKDDGHGKLDPNDAENENERDVEHDVGRDTADRLGIDKPDSGDILETSAHVLHPGAVHHHGDILALVTRVGGLDFIEKGGIGDLTVLQPLEQAQIQDAGFVDGQVSRRVLHLIPRPVDFTLLVHRVEIVPRRRRCMTVCRVRVSGQVDSRFPILIVQITREIPRHSIPVLRNCRRVRRRQNVQAILVDFLKQETRVLASGHPVVHKERVLRSVECRSRGRVVPVSKVIAVPVDDQRRVARRSTLDSDTGRRANGLGETECDETDGGHQKGVDRDESDLFPPRTLRLGCSFPADVLEDKVGDADGEEVAVNHPPVLRSRNKVSKTSDALVILVPRIIPRRTSSRPRTRRRRPLSSTDQPLLTRRRRLPPQRRTPLQEIQPTLRRTIRRLPCQD